MHKYAAIKNTRITITFIAMGLVFSLILPYSFVVAQQTPFRFYQPPSSYSPFPQPPQYPSQEQFNSQSQPQNPSTTMATAAVTIYDDFNTGTYSLRDGQYSPNGKWLDVYGGF